MLICNPGANLQPVNLQLGANCAYEHSLRLFEASMRRYGFSGNFFLCSLTTILVSIVRLLCIVYHYANAPMQYIIIFHGCKNVNFQMKKI